MKENGEKISDAYEWNHSMKACRELERKFGLKQVEDKRKELLEPYLKKADYQNGDVKKQVSNIVKSVFGTYRFQSFGEYSALLSCFNIETKQVKGEFDGVTYNGIVYTMTDDTGNRFAHPSSLPLSGNATGMRDWKNVSVTMPVSTKPGNGSRRFGTRWLLPCTVAVATGKHLSVCLPEKV